MNLKKKELRNEMSLEEAEAIITPIIKKWGKRGMIGFLLLVVSGVAAGFIHPLLPVAFGVMVGLWSLVICRSLAFKETKKELLRRRISQEAIIRKEAKV